MNYFKSIIISAAVIATISTAAFANCSVGNPCIDDNPEVKVAESELVDNEPLMDSAIHMIEGQGSIVVTLSEDTITSQEYPNSIDESTMCGYSDSCISEDVKVMQEVAELQEESTPSIETFSSVADFQVNKSYNIPVEFYYSLLPEEIHHLAECVRELERTQEISSMFLIAVAATEVGWHGEFAGENNWFNWTPDAQYYQGFASTKECVEYTGKRFKESFFNPEWYASFGQEGMDDCFTVSEINSRYAFYDDCSVNWYWGDVVTEILESFNNKYMRWLEENDG